MFDIKNFKNIYSEGKINHTAFLTKSVKIKGKHRLCK